MKTMKVIFHLWLVSLGFYLGFLLFNLNFTYHNQFVDLDCYEAVYNLDEELGWKPSIEFSVLKFNNEYDEGWHVNPVSFI